MLLVELAMRQKAVNSYLPSVLLTSEQTPQLATGIQHPSLLLKPNLSGKDSCTGQQLSSFLRYATIFLIGKKNRNQGASIFIYNFVLMGVISLTRNQINLYVFENFILLLLKHETTPQQNLLQSKPVSN